MDINEKISALLADKSMPVDTDWALAILDRHPAFAVLAALLLSRNSDLLAPETKKKLQASVALGCADRAAICDLADLAGCDWSEFYPAPAAPRQKSTVDTIDTFIDTYGNPSAAETELLERLIFNPVPPDYLQGQGLAPVADGPLALPPELDPDNDEPLPPPYRPAKAAATPATPATPAAQPPKREEKPAVQPPKREEKPAAQPPTPATEPKPAEHHGRKQKAAEAAGQDDLFMESLAKIFIKQRRYSRALEIISNLSLNYPEKSAYFADQIRYLRMLVCNQAKKQQ